MARFISAIALLIPLIGATVAAQSTGGTLIGRVTDPANQPIARADVRVSDDLRGNVRTTVTDDTGFYRFVDLPPAQYAVGASASGFRQITRAAVPLTVDSTVRIDFRLQIAAVAQTIDVVASLHPVQTTSGALGMVLDEQQIGSLPLNRRDFLQLALLAPGVAGPVEGSELSSRGGVAMHANGAREEFNDFLLDGVDNNDPYVNRYVVQPSVDTIQEFKVATNAYSAEYGRNAGGQVNVVTRSGTNRLEGFVSEYFRNQAMNAPNYFDGDDKQPFRRNQFGGGVGGPVVSDRTFFFGSIDVLREQQGLSRLGTVPGAQERLGDLSGLGATVMDPFSGAPFPGNVIPAARISPIARKVVALFPAANRSGAVNYLGQPSAHDNHDQGNVRVDHRLSSSGQLTVRYTYGRSSLVEPYTEGTGVTSGFGDLVDDRTWNLMAQHQQTIGSRIVNSFRFGANGFGRDLLTENHNTDVGAQWGVDWLDVPPQSFGYPVIDVAGYSRIGDAFSVPILRNARTYQFTDSLSLDRGSHFIKVGGEVRHVRLDSQVDLFSRGQLSFTGAFTGTGIGDLLLGLPTFGIQAQADNPIRLRTNAIGTYVQDDWRVRPNLTLNLGARYEYISPPVDERDGMSTLDLATGRIVAVGTNAVSRSGMRPDRNNVAPRLGASWSLAPNTVVRGGYGLFYDSGMLTVNTAQYFNPPQFNLRVFFPGPQGLLTLADPFPLQSGFTPPATLSVLSPDLVSSYLQDWNVAVQHDIASVATVTVAYAGSKGSHLIRPRNINQAPPGPGDVDARRPFPGYADIFFVESEGRSRYDSLQMVLDRRLSKGFSVSAVYTLARSNDDASAFLGTPADKNLPQDSRNVAAEWGPSSFDVRHRFTLAYVIELPQGNPWTRNTQIQGITIVHTGQPFTPILRFDNSNSGNTGGSTAGSDRPNQTGDPALDSPSSDAWFNTAAFAIPPRYTFGNAGRNSVRGPGFGTFDISVSRRVSTARANLTVGLQAFNLFNRTNFNLPEHLVDEPTTFGRIFSAQAPRQLQVMARLGF